MSTMPATVSAGLQARGPAAKPIPLHGVAVDAKLVDFAARVTVTQRYVNDETHPIEAVYVFPLDEASALCGFEAEIGGRRIVARVEERERAFEVYDDALASGHGAYLLDQETPDVFTASVGNVPPGATVLIRITTVAELPLEGDDIRFTLPTTVSPRYAPPADRKGVGQTKAERLNPERATAVPYGLVLTATLAMSGRVKSVESPTHAIRVESLDGGHARVELATREATLDRDFVLKVGLLEPLAPRAVVETDPDGDAHVLACFRPVFEAGQEAPVEIVFVLDRSGSMQGTSIAEARSALKLALRSLRPGSFFNVVGFGNHYECLFPESRAYTDETLTAATAHVDGLDADMGGTDVLPALQFVLGQEARPGIARRVVLLTDGQVTNTEEVIALVRKHSTHTRVFTFGIGAGASHHLVKGVARAGEGAAEHIAPDERIGPKVLRQLARVVSPGLTDVVVSWEGAAAQQAPHFLPPVFMGERLLVYAKLPPTWSGRVTLRGRGPAGEVSFTMAPERLSAQDRVLGTLWARAAIRDLEEGRSAWHDRRGSLQARDGGDRVKAEIVRLAKAYGLASRETSFVGVEERDVPTEGQAELRRVPIALTHGWGGHGHSAVRGRPAATTLAMPVAALHVRAAAPAAPGAEMPRASSGFLARFFGSAPPPSSAPEASFDLECASADDVGFESAASARPTPGRSARALDRLAALQQADGSWALTAELAAFLGASLETLVRQASSHGFTTEAGRSGFATALALAWLEAHAEADRDEWALLARKAGDWLRQGGMAPSDAFTRAAREFERSLRV